MVVITENVCENYGNYIPYIDMFVAISFHNHNQRDCVLLAYRNENYLGILLLSYGLDLHNENTMASEPV